MKISVRGNTASQIEVYQLNPITNRLCTSSLDLDSPAELIHKGSELTKSLSEAVKTTHPNPTPDEPWRLVEIRDDIEIFTRCYTENQLSYYMSRALIQASPIEIKYLIKQSSNREQFDPMCRGVTVLRTVDESTVIVRLLNTKYFLHREFCIIRHDETSPDGSVCLSSNSVKTPQYPIGEFSRAVVINSGFYLEPQGKGTSRMTYIVMADLRIWLPRFILDSIIQAQVFEVLNKIRNHFKKSQNHYDPNMKSAESLEGRN